MLAFFCSLFLLTHNVYFCIGFPKKFQSYNLRDEYMGFFQPGLKLQSTLPDCCCDYKKQSQPWKSLSPSWNFQITSKEDILHWILLFHVFFELNNNIFLMSKTFKPGLAIPWSFCLTSKRSAEISAKLFGLTFFVWSWCLIWGLLRVQVGRGFILAKFQSHPSLEIFRSLN